MFVILFIYLYDFIYILFLFYFFIYLFILFLVGPLQKGTGVQEMKQDITKLSPV